jgi:hypothetical protein
VTTANGLVGILGWCVDDFYDEMVAADTTVLQETLTILREPDDDTESWVAKRSRAGIAMIEKELRGR